MFRPLPRHAGRPAFNTLTFSGLLSPGGAEQFRLDRLLELRAVIDSLRAERGRDLLGDVHPGVDRH